MYIFQVPSLIENLDGSCLVVVALVEVTSSCIGFDAMVVEGKTEQPRMQFSCEILRRRFPINDGNDAALIFSVGMDVGLSKSFLDYNSS